MTTFISIHDKLQLYRESTDDGCLRNDHIQPAVMIPATLCAELQVTTGADSDPSLSAEAVNLLLPHLHKMTVQDFGPLTGMLSEDDDEGWWAHHYGLRET